MLKRINTKNILLILSTITDKRFPRCDDLEISEVLRNDSHLNSILRACLNNRVLYAFVSSLLERGYTKKDIASRGYRTLMEIYEEGNKWIDRLNVTIQYISEASRLTETPTLIIKTLSYPQDVTFDVDVLLKSKEDFPRIRSLLEKKFEIRVISDGYELFPKTEQFLPIDIYRDIRSHNSQIIDPKFLWSKVRSMSYKGLQVTVRDCRWSSTARLRILGHRGGFHSTNP